MIVYTNMINKQLEKALKDAIKEKKHILGVKQVLGSIKNSKLVILSKSISNIHENEINESAKKEKIPTFSKTIPRACGSPANGLDFLSRPSSLLL